MMIIEGIPSLFQPKRQAPTRADERSGAAEHTARDCSGKEGQDDHRKGNRGYIWLGYLAPLSADSISRLTPTASAFRCSRWAGTAPLTPMASALSPGYTEAGA
jgi:hypothetical protein